MYILSKVRPELLRVLEALAKRKGIPIEKCTLRDVQTIQQLYMYKG